MTYCLIGEDCTRYQYADNVPCCHHCRYRDRCADRCANRPTRCGQAFDAGRKSHRWTEEETVFLASQYQAGATMREIGVTLGLTEEQCWNRWKSVRKRVLCV